MTSRVFWALVLTHLITWGDAFIGKSFVGNRVVALWPIEPWRVRIQRVNGVKTFQIRDAYGRYRPEPYSLSEVIHVMGMSLDGVRGMSPIEMAREAIGAGLAMDAYRNYFFRNGAIPRGVLEVDEALDQESGERLRADWESKYRGLKNAGRIAILEEGLKFNAIALPFADAQFVEQTKMSKAEIAMIFGIPASKIGAESGNSLTYKTVESDNLAFLTDCGIPWLGLMEEAVGLDPDIFPVPTSIYDSPVFPMFNVDSFLRADTFNRYRSLQIAVGNRPWMQPSEARAMENMPSDDSFDKLPPAADRIGDVKAGGTLDASEALTAPQRRRECQPRHVGPPIGAADDRRDRSFRQAARHVQAAGRPWR
jgi:HK97 family phage portal protein